MRPDRRRWPTKTPGKRGTFLLLFGVLYCFLGAGVALVPIQPDADLFYQHWPVWVRAGLWVGSGLIAIGYAWQPPRRADAPGFLALYLMPLERVLANGVAWVIYLVQGHGGYRYGWLSALIYLFFMALVALVAGWPEPKTVETIAVMLDQPTAETGPQAAS